MTYVYIIEKQHRTEREEDQTNKKQTSGQQAICQLSSCQRDIQHLVKDSHVPQ